MYFFSALFRLLTLFRMKKRFRDVFGTTVILMPRLFSAVVVLLLLYYFFAIIGMECFHGLKLKDCCVNTSVQQFYHDFGEGSRKKIFCILTTDMHCLEDFSVKCCVMKGV